MKVMMTLLFSFLGLWLVAIWWLTPEIPEESTIDLESLPPEFTSISVPPERLEEFIQEVNMIEIGSSVEEIIERLGPPDLDQTTMSKNVRDPKFLNRSVKYFSKRITPGSSNRNDSFVNLNFNEQDQLVSVYSIHIPGVEVRGDTPMRSIPEEESGHGSTAQER